MSLTLTPTLTLTPPRQHTLGEGAGETIAATLDLARCLHKAARDAAVAVDGGSDGHSDSSSVAVTGTVTAVTEATVAAAAAVEAVELAEEAAALDAQWVAGLEP